MELLKMHLDCIIPYDKNPRKNDCAVDAVVESIKQCGYCQPIFVDEDNVIIAGHTRYKALKKLGYKECEVIVRTDMTEEQKRKYRLLDNKTNELAEWDLGLLAEELEGLDFGGFDFGFGGEAEEIDIDELDDDEEEDYKAIVKFTFDDYASYSRVEYRLKEIADEIGARMTVSGT
jgi:hypothetical protein